MARQFNNLTCATLVTQEVEAAHHIRALLAPHNIQLLGTLGTSGEVGGDLEAITGGIIYKSQLVLVGNGVASESGAYGADEIADWLGTDHGFFTSYRITAQHSQEQSLPRRPLGILIGCAPGLERVGDFRSSSFDPSSFDAANRLEMLLVDASTHLGQPEGDTTPRFPHFGKET